jgi:hypothetical protein
LLPEITQACFNAHVAISCCDLLFLIASTTNTNNNSNNTMSMEMRWFGCVIAQHADELLAAIQHTITQAMPDVSFARGAEERSDLYCNIDLAEVGVKLRDYSASGSRVTGRIEKKERHSRRATGSEMWSKTLACAASIDMAQPVAPQIVALVPGNATYRAHAQALREQHD